MSSSRYMYQAAQNSRVATETMRSYFQTVAPHDEMGGGTLGNDAPDGQLRPPGGHDIMPVPDAKDCIGQVVLDWEFVHDLDLHLMKVDGLGDSRPATFEPNPEPHPDPLASRSFNLASLVDPRSGDLMLSRGVTLEPFVSYRRKGVLAQGDSGDAPMQAVLQLDRNAAVHSHKPVENCYLTRNLEPGVYAVKVHNYSQRQLRPDVIPGTYMTWEDFTKRDPGYQQMESAAKAQAEHASDAETPELTALMAKADNDYREGFGKVAAHCFSGDTQHGVHYGLTIYTYPVGCGSVAKHPQAASLDELENVFASVFFATSESIMEERGPQEYNGGNRLADTRTEDGKLALCEKDEAIVALLHVVKDGNGSRLAEVKVLAGTPAKTNHASSTVQSLPMSRHQALHRGQRPAGGYPGGGQPQIGNGAGMVQRVSNVPQRITSSMGSTREPMPEPMPLSYTANPMNTTARPLPYPTTPQLVRQVSPAQSMPQPMPQCSVQQTLPPQLVRQVPPAQPMPQPLQQPMPQPQPVLRQIRPVRPVQRQSGQQQVSPMPQPLPQQVATVQSAQRPSGPPQASFPFPVPRPVARTEVRPVRAVGAAQQPQQPLHNASGHVQQGPVR